MKYTIPLSGDWDFYYCSDTTSAEAPVLPDQKLYTVKMPVPGYWDDNAEAVQSGFRDDILYNPDYHPVGFPMEDAPADASLPYIVGVGYYRKTFEAKNYRPEGNAKLVVGGVRLEAWIWLNGQLVIHHFGHSTPFTADLNEHILPNGTNEIVIAVSNTRTDRSGCALRGYQGCSAGIYGDIYVELAVKCSIESCYVYPTKDDTICWEVELRGEVSGGMQLEWALFEPETSTAVGRGTVFVTGNSVTWTTETGCLKLWSDKEPNLYTMEICLRERKEVVDCYARQIGFRVISVEDDKLLLNGKPVFLRGATDHCYFPETCTQSADIEYYSEIIRRLKQIGFNWIRCHTWVPPAQFMEAADRVGIMLQVEAPVGFEEQEWIDILRFCRNHPSVVLYCAGNEELLDEDKLEYLRRMSVRCHELVPDALFSPQEALRGIEYGWNATDIGEGAVEDPYLHNPERMETVKTFADVLEPYTWGLLSYYSADGDPGTIDSRLEEYHKPCLAHELGIHSSYLDLSLADRYRGTRIGPDLYEKTAEYLHGAGLLDKDQLYYKNSCAWMQTLRKHNIETARKCKTLSGYDFLGAIDHHWHRTGYPGGIMNEFYELKPGESAEDVLRYNGESVLLLNNTNNRTLHAGESIALELLASIYGRDIGTGKVSWHFSDWCGNVSDSGEWSTGALHCGSLENLGLISLRAPNTTEAMKLTLNVSLSAGEFRIDNNWDYWVFPSCPEPENIRIVREIEPELLSFLSAGGQALLLGPGTFPTMPTGFQIACAGRTLGNLATVIYDHPLLEGFAHEGFCDWQFYSMLEGGSAVVFNDINAPFAPIIEVVSSYKRIFKQSNLFVYSVGQGYLVVCTMNLDTPSPAARYLLHQLSKYLQNSNKGHVPEISPGEIQRLISADKGADFQTTTDMAFDPNAQID